MLDLITSKWVRIIGDSMLPTMRDGARVRVSRSAYWRRSPRRGDVVLIEHPRRDGFWEVKRVVGLPGECVRLSGDVLEVDGDAVDEPYSLPSHRIEEHEWRLGADEYVLLGDNRGYSTDSRQFGAVGRRQILGKVMLRDDVSR